MSIDDPVSCAECGMKHNLLDKSGWKSLRRFAKISKRLIRVTKQSRLHQVKATIWYQYHFLKSPEITMMPSGLTSKMETPSGKRQLTLNLTKSGSTKFSKICNLHPGITLNSRMHPRTTRRSKSTFCLLSNMMVATRQG